jgi:ABC-type transport system involved in multi-copper enzyme maturation permease subunit
MTDDRALDPAEPVLETEPVDVRPIPTETVAPPTAERRPRRPVGARARGAFAGLSAVGVKELRGRMRGRRAFVILTVYLVLLGAFAFMMELILEQQFGRGLAGAAAYASASIGRGVFIALMMLETLLVVALAPAFTAGAISMEREKQTLDMLATTPISSLSIVVAKLLSALTYLFILIFASIPLTALVFVFGGVAPDDVIRSYVVLIATAIGLGAVGLFFSALLKRTQAATIATYFGMLFVTLGAFFVFYFWNEIGAAGNGRGIGPIKGRPPEALVWLNPYFAQADIMCGVEDGFGDWCGRIAFVSERPVFGGITPTEPAEPPVDPGVAPGVGGGNDGVVAPEVQPFGVIRDSFWPKSAIAWLVLAGALLIASIQLVNPTRRWRLGLRRSHRDVPGRVIA